MTKKWHDVSIGITISYNTEEICKLCDYYYIMYHGEMINMVES